MQVLKARIEITDKIDGHEICKKLERTGRVCYKSEDRITETSYEPFLRSIISRGHEAILEHANISVHITCDRGVTHEIVRHRIASYAQESTRYCNYAGDGIAVIFPAFWDPSSVFFRNHKGVDKCVKIWEKAMEQDNENYRDLIEAGATPQEARTVLANSLKTEIDVTMNIREWRHFFQLRCAPSAHPQMREIACRILVVFKKYIPVLFDDIETELKENETKNA